MFCLHVCRHLLTSYRAIPQHLSSARLTTNSMLHMRMRSAIDDSGDTGLALIAQFAVCRVAIGSYYWALLVAAVWRLPAPRPGEEHSRCHHGSVLSCAADQLTPM